MNSLLILGKGGFGRVVKEAAQAMNCFDKIEFLDDNLQSGALDVCAEYEKYCKEYMYAYPAFGKNKLRLEWIERLVNAGYKLASIVHPCAYVSPTAELSSGVCILANASVGASASLASGVIINMGAIADHDCILAQGVHIAPGAVVKASACVERLAKIESGEVASKAGI